MKRSLNLFILTLSALNLFAQKEATWWYFGNNAGISFTGTNGAPVVQTNGRMSNFEGVASISNSKGGLLFYTDGERVYNKQHNVMINGGSGGTDVRLLGHNSATQSAVIVQQPVRGERYWIFTVTENWGNNGFNYSVVDTSLNGGNGQVIQKNIPLLTKNFNNKNAPEKMAAVKHANRVDTWIVNHTGGDNNFYMYKLTSKGLNAPIVQAIGPTWAMTGTGAIGYSKGYMKFSPDGTKLICAIAGEQSGFTGGYANKKGRIEIYDFDNLTGVLSNAQVIDNSNIATGVGNMSSVYGVEVSPNGRYLYISFYIPSWITTPNGDGNDGIWQLDLLAGNAAAIGASCVKVVTSFSNWAGGGMQLGPDGKIYLARSKLNGTGAAYLSCITKPNCQGTACTFVDNQISISPRQSQMGLPTFINSFFNKAEFEWGSNAANLCENALTKLFLTDTTGVDSAHWKFDDPGSGKQNTAKGFTVYHKFSTPKSFRVFVQLFRKVTSPDCYADTARKRLTIFPNPKPRIGRDSVICAGGEVILFDTSKSGTFLWSDNSAVPSYIANKKGWHWVEVRVGGCVGRDSMYLDVISFPDSSFVYDSLSICQYDSIKLTASKGQKYIWSTGDTTASIHAKKHGIVWVGVSNGSCFSYDTVFINVVSVPIINIGRDTILCQGDSITLKAKTNAFRKSIVWSTLKTDSILKVKTTGVYWAMVNDTMCSSLMDTVRVTFQNKLSLNLGKDTFICRGKSYLINAPVTGGQNWLWHDNSKATTNLATTAGKKYVKVTAGACSVSDTIIINEIVLQPFSLGKDTTLCIGQTVDIIPGALTDVEFTWMGTVINYSYPITKTGKYYVDLRDLPKKVCKSSDTILVTFTTPTKINLGNDTLLCIGQLTDLSIAKYGFKSFKWFDNNNTQTRKNDPNVKKPLVHWVEGDNGFCKSRDTIIIDYRPALNVSIGADINLCNNETRDFDLTTSFATQYEWLDINGIPFLSVPKFTVNNPGGQFIGKVSDGFCPKSDTVTVVYDNSPLFSIGADIQVCDGIPNPVIIDASSAAADSYLWSTGAVTPSITVVTQGMYSVRASNSNCSSSDTAFVNFSDGIDNSFGFTDSVFCDIPNLKYDFSQPNTSFLWMDGSMLPTRRITAPGIYTLVAANVCDTQMITVNITLDETGCTIWWPTAFSPNGDNVNDVWKPLGEVSEWVEMVVYNRWGEAIYKGNPAKGWDGIIGGEYVQDGVYPMTISFRKSTNGFPRMFVKNMVLTVLK